MAAGKCLATSGQEDYIDDPRRVPAQLSHFRARFYIPEMYQPTPQACGERPPAVGRESHTHRLYHRETTKLFPTFQVPQAHSSVRTSGKGTATIGRDRHPSDSVGVSFQHADLLAGLDVPQPHS